MSRRRKRPAFAALAVALSVAGALLCAEAALRFFGESLGVTHVEVFSIPLDGRLHRASSLADLGWELVPNARETFQGVEAIVNSIGFRDRDFGPKQGAKRIAFLGDSITFGASVAQDLPYSRQLETLLNEQSGKKVETLNTGVSGYNFIQEAIGYETKARAFDPDLVIVGYFADDFMPPYVPEGRSLWPKLQKRSALLAVLADRMPGLAGEQSHRVSRAEEKALLRLHAFKAQMDREHRALLFVFHPELEPGGYIDHYGYQVCRRACTMLGIPVIEMRLVYEAAGRPFTDFSIDPKGNPHPNAAGHRLIAETIRDFLERNPEALGW